MQRYVVSIWQYQAHFCCVGSCGCSIWVLHRVQVHVMAHDLNDAREGRAFSNHGGLANGKQMKAESMLLDL